VTHLSASDSFSTMALYKSIYLLTCLSCRHRLFMISLCQLVPSAFYARACFRGSSVGKISEWEGLRSRRRKRRGGWGVRGLPHPHWGGIYGGGYAPPQKSVHFAMLQTTKYCSRIQVKTHSTMLSINFLSSYVNKQHTWAILFYHVRMTSASCHNDVPRL